MSKDTVNSVFNTKILKCLKKNILTKVEKMGKFVLSINYLGDEKLNNKIKDRLEKVISNEINEFNSFLKECSDIKELEKLIDKYANIKFGGVENQMNKLEELILDDTEQNEDLSITKFSNYLINSQIGFYLAKIKNVLDIILENVKKIGGDSIFDEVDVEDIEYLLQLNYTTLIDKLCIWLDTYRTYTGDIRDKILDLQLPDAYEVKLKKLEIIHDFFEVRLTNILDSDLDSSFSEVDIQDISKKAQVLKFGSDTIEEFQIFIEIAVEILKHK